MGGGGAEFIKLRSVLLFIFRDKFSQQGLPDFSWNNIPKQGKSYQIATALPNDHARNRIIRNIFQIAIKYINLFYSKGLQNLSKLGFLV
jgi:hypothetical protein